MGFLPLCPPQASGAAHRHGVSELNREPRVGRRGQRAFTSLVTLRNQGSPWVGRPSALDAISIATVPPHQESSRSPGTGASRGGGGHPRAILTRDLVRTLLAGSGHSCADGRHPASCNRVLRSCMGFLSLLLCSQAGLCPVPLHGGASWVMGPRCPGLFPPPCPTSHPGVLFSPLPSIPSRRCLQKPRSLSVHLSICLPACSSGAKNHGPLG